MPQSNSLRQPLAKEKVLIVALALYALVVIGPDTLRPFLQSAEEEGVGVDCSESTKPTRPAASGLARWYPLATLGFEADNDGIVVGVDDDGPAARRGIRPGQQIDLLSVKPDRRAINKFVYVAPDSCFTFRVVAGSSEPFTVTVPATPEKITGWHATTLLLAQGSAMLFIFLCVYLCGTARRGLHGGSSCMGCGLTRVNILFGTRISRRQA